MQLFSRIALLVCVATAANVMDVYKLHALAAVTVPICRKMDGCRQQDTELFPRSDLVQLIKEGWRFEEVADACPAKDFMLLVSEDDGLYMDGSDDSPFLVPREFVERLMAESSLRYRDIGRDEL